MPRRIRSALAEMSPTVALIWQRARRILRTSMRARQPLRLYRCPFAAGRRRPCRGDRPRAPRGAVRRAQLALADLLAAPRLLFEAVRREALREVAAFLARGLRTPAARARESIPQRRSL